MMLNLGETYTYTLSSDDGLRTVLVTITEHLVIDGRKPNMRSSAVSMARSFLATKENGTVKLLLPNEDRKDHQVVTSLLHIAGISSGKRFQIEYG